jgi:hypothetical protein
MVVNQTYGLSFVPTSDTKDKLANCEYLLKTIDMANNYVTNYGESQWATGFVINEEGVDLAVKTLQKKTNVL